MHVLLTRLSALGDIVHTWPLVEALRRDGRVSRIAWVVEEPFADLVRSHPAVDATITVATRRWRRRLASSATRSEIAEARRAVESFGADAALDAQGLIKSAFWAAIAGVPTRIGFARASRRERLAGAFYTETITPPAGARHVVDVNLSLLTALGIAPPFGSVPDGRFLLSGTNGALPPPGCVAILPAAGGRGKVAGPELLGAVARHCHERGHLVTVVWGPGEYARAEAVVQASAGCAQLAPKTNIVELARYLGACSAVVGADTGPVHLAASLGVPTVALHLTTDPARNGPRGARVTTVDATEGIAERGRARVRAAREIGDAEVMAAIDALLVGDGDRLASSVPCDTR